MNCNQEKIREGITLHTIKTEKFKTNLLAVYLTTPLKRETVTLNALIPAILKRGSKNIKTSDEISKKLEEMYGASFDCGIDKIGDNQVLKFYLESINNEFLPINENLLKESIDKLLEIVFNPLLENNKFKEEYINSEKENLKQIIEGKIDNKAQYAFTRCIEEMYKNKPYGLYKYGYVEDLENINAENLYNQYQQLIKNCKIDIFISGNINEKILEIVKENEDIKKMNERQAQYIISGEKLDEQNEIKTIEDRLEISQGKLVIGLNINEDTKQSRYIATVYNAIFGGIPTSKMFQNVREKASLAYSASSSYLKHKNNIFIRCGIEIENYEKAVELIKQQLEEMKNGNFTEEEINSAKTNIIATIKSIPDEQDTEITYYFGQELSEIKMAFEEYESNINSVTKQNIIDFASKVKINTIYFLRGN